MSVHLDINVQNKLKVGMTFDNSGKSVATSGAGGDKCVLTILGLK